MDALYLILFDKKSLKWLSPVSDLVIFQEYFKFLMDVYQNSLEGNADLVSIYS